MIIKRFLFLCLFLLFILPNIVFSDNSISIDLKNKNLGPGQSFEGTADLNFNGNASANSLIVAKISDSVVSSSTLYDLFFNSSLKFTLRQGVLSRIGDPWSTKKILSSGGSSIFGVLLPANTKTISSFVFSVSGLGGPVYIDVNNDGTYDYKYRGGINSFSSEVYPIGVDSSVVTDSFASINGNGNQKRCQTFNLSFDNLYNESLVVISANVKKEASGQDLTLSIGSKTCDVNYSSMSNISYGISSCNITVTDLGSSSYSVCAYVKSGNTLTTYYKVPSRADKNYFSLTLKKAQYIEDISGGGIISDIKIKNKINEYLSSCSSNCIVALNLSLGSSGSVTVSDILLRDSSGIEYNSFYDLADSGDYLVLNGTYKMLLSKMPGLVSPSQKGSYTLRISYDSLDNQTLFNVSDVPVAVIDSSATSGVVGSTFDFSATKSSSINGKITKYLWDFGDNSTDTGEKVSHAYSKNGDFILSLYVEDVKGIRSPATKLNIKILNFDQIIPSYLNETKDQIGISRNYFDTSKGELRKVLEDIAYDKTLKTYLTNVTLLEKEYYSNVNSTDEQKRKIYNSLENIRKNIISYISFNIVEKPNDIPLLNDIISTDYFKKDVNSQAKIDFRDALYEYNSRNLKVDTTLYYMVIGYSWGKKNATLVKKHVIYGIDTQKILENLKENDPLEIVVITPLEYEFNKEFNVISFDAKSTQDEDIVYLLVGETKEVPSTVIYNGKQPVENLYFCGDKICTEPYEDKENCPLDCKKKTPVLLYALLVVLVLLGVYYFNFYKGKGNYRDLGNFLAIKIAGRRIFTNSSDLEKLDTYVKLKISQGFKEHDIKEALVKKGWTDKQIDFAFERAK